MRPPQRSATRRAEPSHSRTRTITPPPSSEGAVATISTAGSSQVKSRTLSASAYATQACSSAEIAAPAVGTSA